jgi:molecular chaperone GrpE
MDNIKNPFKKNEENKETIEENKQEEVQEEQPEVQEEEQEENKENNKYEELNNKYIRLAADFDNFRKRTAQEKEELSKYTTVEILKKIASNLDTFDRAKEGLKDIEDSVKIKEGYEIAYKQLLDTLTKIGLEEIEAVGKPFNPNEHEAITQVPTDEYEADTIALVAQKGYKYQDRIVRPALVGVAKNKENE